MAKETAAQYLAKLQSSQRSYRARSLYGRTTSTPARGNTKVRSEYYRMKDAHTVPTPTSRGRTAGLKAETMADLRGTKHPLGHKEHPVTLNNEPSQHHITGRIKKFRRRVAPGSLGVRTGWKGSRTHHFQRRLHIRKHRLPHIKGWRRTRGRLIPK